MKPFSLLGNSIGGLLDRIACVAGAAACAQLPEFIQQYLQRLGGHLDEARRTLAQFTSLAGKCGMSLDAFIHQTAQGAAPAGPGLAHLMQGSVERVSELAAAEQAIREASPWARPFVFFQNMDMDIAANTWAIFKPAMPVTPEGLAYAAAGMLLGLLVFKLTAYGSIRLCRSLRSPAQKPAA